MSSARKAKNPSIARSSFPVSARGTETAFVEPERDATAIIDPEREPNGFRHRCLALRGYLADFFEESRSNATS